MAFYSLKHFRNYVFICDYWGWKSKTKEAIFDIDNNDLGYYVCSC